MSSAEYKFVYGVANGEDNVFIVSKSKFSEIEADKLFVEKQKLPLEKAKKITGWVYSGFAYNEDNEEVLGCWFSRKPLGRCAQEVYAYVY